MIPFLLLSSIFNNEIKKYFLKDYKTKNKLKNYDNIEIKTYKKFIL